MDHQTFRKISGYSLGLILIAFSILGWDLYKLMYRPMLAKQTEPLVIELSASTSANHLVRTLKDLKLIQSARLMSLLIRSQGMSHRLKAGIYQIQPGESAQHFLKRVVQGDVLIESFRIVEGSTLKTVLDNLHKAPYLKLDQDNLQSFKGIHASAEGL